MADRLRFYVLLFAILFLSNAQTNAQQVEISKLSDTVQIATVDVSATVLEGRLNKISGNISLLNADKLSSLSELAITEHLNTIPGVQMQSGTYNTNRIVIRGIGSRTPYSTNRVRAYLNDIPLTNGDGVTFIEDIDVERLGRVEVIKEPSSALYGDGLGGTIKLSTARQNELLQSSLHYGSFYTMKINAGTGFGYKNGQATLSFHHTSSDGYRQNSNYQRNSVYLTADKKVVQANVGFTLVYSDLMSQIPSSLSRDVYETVPQRAASNWLSVEGYKNQRRLLAGVSVQARFNPRWSNTATFFGGGHREFEKRPFNNLEEESVRYGLRNRLFYSISNFDTVAGFEFFGENHHWRTFLDDDSGETTVNDIDELRLFGNIFAMFNYKVNSRLLLTAGANVNRLNYCCHGKLNDEGEHRFPFIVSPRMGLNYEVIPGMNLYASAGHGFSAPSLQETLLPDGEKNPELKPEQGWMFELGSRIASVDGRLFIDASAYHILLRDLLVTKRISEAVFTGINAGRSSHSGVELQAGYLLLNSRNFPGWLKLEGTAALAQNIFVQFEDDGNDYSGKNLTGVPNNTFNFRISWKPLSSLLFNMNMRHSGMQYLDDGNTQNVEGYWLSNVKLSYRLNVIKRLNLKFDVGINNFFDDQYVSMILPNAPSFGATLPRYFYPGAPRNWYIKVGVWF
ncbi:MAG: TonB-dependent receptor [Prolixibacteraceae bacterium]|jgi:iron complex outermembrane receptor protein|nr:TonB-dependent receptor [Prolixibacteraceae bacterium]